MLNIDFDICPELHAMSDVGFASDERKAQGYTYSKPRTHDAECYASKCDRRGICLKAKIYKKLPA